MYEVDEVGGSGGGCGSFMFEVDEVGGSGGGCPYESPMYESPIHKRTPRAGSIAVGSFWWKNWKPVEALFGI